MPCLSHVCRGIKGLQDKIQTDETAQSVSSTNYFRKWVKLAGTTPVISLSSILQRFPLIIMARNESNRSGPIWIGHSVFTLSLYVYLPCAELCFVDTRKELASWVQHNQITLWYFREIIIFQPEDRSRNCLALPHDVEKSILQRQATRCSENMLRP